MAKTDIKNAYKQVPIHLEDYELLGFKEDTSFTLTTLLHLVLVILEIYFKNLIHLSIEFRKQILCSLYSQARSIGGGAKKKNPKDLS